METNHLGRFGNENLADITEDFEIPDTENQDTRMTLERFVEVEESKSNHLEEEP